MARWLQWGWVPGSSTSRAAAWGRMSHEPRVTQSKPSLTGHGPTASEQGHGGNRSIDKVSWWARSRSSQQAPVWRQGGFGVYPGRAIGATTAGDRAGLRDTYNIVQASPGHLSPSLNRAPRPWAKSVGRGPRWGWSGQFRPVSALTTLTWSAQNLWGPRSYLLCASIRGKIRMLIALFQAYP